jgi:KipI family sensor histidine kinase inhibitor
VLVRELPIEPWRFAEAARQLGATEAVAAYDTVGLFGWHGDLEQILRYAGSIRIKQHRVDVSVHYDGPDLHFVCDLTGLSPSEVAQLHASETYTCAAVGFRPGFAYLGSLPVALRGVRRLDNPRLRVAAGSLGITGSQTAIYPMESPGGWAVIGSTTHDMSHFPIAAGDEVRFVPVSSDRLADIAGTPPLRVSLDTAEGP